MEVGAKHDNQPSNNTQLGVEAINYRHNFIVFIVVVFVVLTVLVIRVFFV